MQAPSAAAPATLSRALQASSKARLHSRGVIAVGGAGRAGTPVAPISLGSETAGLAFAGARLWPFRRAERSKVAPAGRAGLPVSCCRGWTWRKRSVLLRGAAHGALLKAR